MKRVTFGSGLRASKALEAPGKELSVGSVGTTARKREAASVHLLEAVLEHGSVDLLEEVER
ncbi:hypothetical protein ACNJFI_21470, partial [Mycobacterium tuberculosis]